MKRLTFLMAAAVAIFCAVALSGAAADDGHGLLNCSEGRFVCAETADAIGYDGRYTGHDEPSLLFYSSTAGAGNSNNYRLQLPSDPKKQPTRAFRVLHRTTRGSRSRQVCRGSRLPTSAATATGSRARTASTHRPARASIHSSRPASRSRTSSRALRANRSRRPRASGSSAVPGSRTPQTRSEGAR